jgi:L-alanine-DL-glutamate epimerase-like enolase superfamily enzyme
MSSLKIANVKVIVTCPDRNYVLVKIETGEPELYGWGDATLNGRELQPYHLLFLEDPLCPEHKESLRLIRQQPPHPSS